MPKTALVLALFVLAAIVTGVAESATKTAIPKQLTGDWRRNDGKGLVVGSRGKVKVISDPGNLAEAAVYVNAKFLHVTAHRLSISGLPSCSGTGTYRWTIRIGHLPGSLNRGYILRLTKIHDACKARVGRFAADIWWRL
jgi:hypothetical protein